MLDRSLINRIWITEKSVMATAKDQYTFWVRPEATKNEIKKLVKELYKVDVVSVNTTTRMAKKKGHGRMAGTKSEIKKAFVTLKKGQTITIQ